VQIDEQPHPLERLTVALDGALIARQPSFLERPGDLFVGRLPVLAATAKPPEAHLVDEMAGIQAGDVEAPALLFAVKPEALFKLCPRDLANLVGQRQGLLAAGCLATGPAPQLAAGNP